MSRIQLRPARPDDVPLILELIAELAEYERLSHENKADAGRMHEHLFGPRPYAEVLIGEVDGVGAGFALFFHNYSTWLSQPGIYLEDLYVRPSARGLGLGKALLSELARLAVERKCGRLEWSVLDWNEPAIGFYRSLGAVPLDEWTVYRLAGDALARLGRRD
ncbi:L-amino acid N-acyltransferase YncA [Pseudomonas citronellolis]|jgi:GNAT superfamily N-acetyltransferase|uniref:Diamine acetyltransferase n=1 Tax=Pseudomonas citronellolis TaxID=53408 RepID=A0A1A9KGE6_9PSED|nr:MULTISPECIES: GNAT family N-acetyltransferase [Pseudomonas]ANI16595.1 diamine acetyltransferase [Pseudomonas citronellolis]KES22557.1 diamine acetyltransferase [Pseudomonas sp. AAC]MBH3432846.1 GNAT family N-acetyltransferase [Pseudomonas citronellolis]MCP1608282.1 GNAT superfamily N-acetyltransferase [Pseudomonas citronellolis]MCP1643878.1 GNAT superfamily N-acetyltransferase [Pseudomonas citronellolis]